MDHEYDAYTRLATTDHARRLIAAWNTRGLPRASAWDITTLDRAVLDVWRHPMLDDAARADPAGYIVASGERYAASYAARTWPKTLRRWLLDKWYLMDPAQWERRDEPPGSSAGRVRREDERRRSRKSPSDLAAEVRAEAAASLPPPDPAGLAERAAAVLADLESRGDPAALTLRRADPATSLLWRAYLT